MLSREDKKKGERNAVSFCVKKGIGKHRYTGINTGLWGDSDSSPLDKF
jgi:hypothetical protein